MKTKEMIRQLQKADPSGEEEVCVGNSDIHFVELLPAYYDGKLQVLVRDEKTKFYNIVGAKILSSGSKVKIHTLSIKDAIWNNHDLPIDYSDLSEENAARYQQYYDKIREEARDVDYKLELENFTEWVKDKLHEISNDTEDYEHLAKKFFDANLSAKDPFPPGLPTVGDGSSYVERRKKQWDLQLKIVRGEESFQIQNEKPMVRDGKGVLWHIDRWNHIVVYSGKESSLVYKAEFDGMEASVDQWLTAFNGHWKNNGKSG